MIKVDDDISMDMDSLETLLYSKYGRQRRVTDIIECPECHLDHK